MTNNIQAREDKSLQHMRYVVRGYRAVKHAGMPAAEIRAERPFCFDIDLRLVISNFDHAIRVPNLRIAAKSNLQIMVNRYGPRAAVWEKDCANLWQMKDGPCVSADEFQSFLASDVNIISVGSFFNHAAAQYLAFAGVVKTGSCHDRASLLNDPSPGYCIVATAPDPVGAYKRLTQKIGNPTWHTDIARL